MGHVARMGEETGVNKISAGKREGKRPLARTRCRWEYNIKMDIQHVGCGYLEGIDLAQERYSFQALLNAVLGIRVL